VIDKKCGALWRKKTRSGEILSGEISLGLMGSYPVALFRNQPDKNQTRCSHVLLTSFKGASSPDGKERKQKYLTVGYLQESNGGYIGYVDMGLGPDVHVEIRPNIEKQSKQADFFVFKIKNDSSPSVTASAVSHVSEQAALSNAEIPPAPPTLAEPPAI